MAGGAVYLAVRSGAIRGGDPLTRAADAPAGVPAYVDEATCGTCHASEAAAWAGSHHDLAMQEATPETVLGDFGDVTFTDHGVTTRFFLRDGGYWVGAEGPDGQTADFEVAYTFGVAPLQQYLVVLPGGRLQSFPIAWDTAAGRWFDLSPERLGPEDPFHWTGPYQNWNLMCAGCHSTGLRKNYDPDSRTYQTTWSVIDVGCQACHGPGEDHLAWASGDRPAGEPGLGLRVDFRGRNAAYEVDQCAACHARRFPVSETPVAGEPLLDHFVPETLREGLYHPDGQILDEVYEYGSFVQSRMYAEGVACSDCHDPHSLDLGTVGNAVCTACHQPQVPDRFPTLNAAVYDTPAHHFHEAGSPGAECVGCHMPERTYMKVDPRRDHSFRPPRPDLSVATGSPNACNACHTDRTAAWAAESIAAWHPGDRRDDAHYGEILARGRAGDPESAGPLAALAADPGRPPIVRAAALELLPAFGDRGLGALITGLDDEHPLVRARAVAGLDILAPADRLEAVAPLLGDPVRAVRTEAARVLASAGLRPDRPEQLAAFGRALAEYEAVQMSMADTPAARVNLGLIHAANGEAGRAIGDFEAALEIDPYFLPAALDLATLLNQLGQNDEAIRVLDDAIARAPEASEARYSLGLLLAETGRIGEASEALAEAAAQMPGNARVRYNYGLALQRLGRHAGAETELLAAWALEPETPAFAEALVILYVQNERWADALPYARDLVRMAPRDPAAGRWLAEVENRLAGAGP